MRSVTFGQGLLAAGLIGLTLMLTLGGELILWMSIGWSAGTGPSIIGPTTMLAIALTLALAVIVMAVRRLKAGADAQPLTSGELLVVVGVLGLLITTVLASQSLAMMATAEWYKSPGIPTEYHQAARHLEFTWQLWQEDLLSYAGSAALQVVALVLPLVVTVFGMRRRRVQRPASGSGVQVAQPHHFAAALGLFGLMVAFAASPAVLNDVALDRSDLDFHWIGYHFFDLALLSVGLAGPVLALVVLRAWTRGNSAPASSPLLLLVAALVGFTTCVATSHALPLLALVVAISLAGLMWINHARPVVEPGQHEVLPTGQLLAGVAALGLIVSFVALPATSTAIHNWRLAMAYGEVSSPYEPMVVMPAIAFAIQLALLALAVRELKAGAASSEAGEGA
ncbi:MAG: hypothetical protein F4081_00850 [Dehalococcoidia bacterium]|nr:hypothetical protein [Dehalococcoidia bacterium]MYI85352.1 hypothetical protein [Dehalococcoidia bacterium]